MKLKGAAMITAVLEKEQVDLVFGYPGGAVLSLYDQLYRCKLKHILVRHEQGAVHAADGYARVSGKTGVVFATSGPGATNLVTGIATAYMDSVPLVLITGQVATRLIGTDSFQEADITGITLPITKHNYLIKDVQELPDALSEAFFIASTGRPGPVLVDIPKDIFELEDQFDYTHRREIPGYKPTIEGHSGQIQRAVKAINAAKRPVIFAGGGVIIAGASAELTELAERGRIPVVLSLMALGAFPGNSPLFLGMPGMHGTVSANYSISEADLIIAAGVRFDDRVTGQLESFARKAQIIHIDIDPAEIGKNVAIDIPIVGDVKKVLQGILKRLQPGVTEDWLKKVEEWRQGNPLCSEKQTSEGGMKPQFVIREIDRLTPDNAIICTDVGQHQMWTAQHYCFRLPRTFLSSGGLGTMGYGFPASLGATLASPQKTVFCIAGDGSFQMNIQELATAVAYNLNIKVAIINNGCLGMVRQWQELFYGGRYSHTSIQGGPDFVKVAEAYGALGLRVSAPSEVAGAIEQALAIEGPVVIDFLVDAGENVYPMVAPNRPISEIIMGSGKR
ncbi:MAG: biosynthetic-type acetolactate synthase large subunit [Dethiobacter sp.]|nr:biosynthetic-type acetolactate synthase large subunit [Dethiobacter sp.]